MKKLRELFKSRDKKTFLYLGALLAVGVMLMFANRLPAGIPAAEDKTAGSAAGAGQETLPQRLDAPDTDYERERALEKRLEEALALVADVGRVRVMLSLTGETETMYAADVNTTESLTKETDAQGGSREISNSTSQDKTILITDGTGTGHPLVLREIAPKIEGVIIIAEGGDNVFVKDALTKAACTVLGVEANKVQIFKMKGE